jgi:hypothetical protein
VTARLAQWPFDVRDVERILTLRWRDRGPERDVDRLRPPAHAEPGSPTFWLQRTDATGPARRAATPYADGDIEEEIALAGLGATRADLGRTGDAGLIGNRMSSISRTSTSP